METNVLLQNIQRIVKENEQYKKDLYDKSNKIEEQNAKITELLMKAQNYVEQSHQILELKNSAFQSNAEKTVNKVLELEQDKMRLTGDLSKLTAQISELNLEVNKM
jgi:FK506-binding protein 15